MTTKTAFFHDERTLWHAPGNLYALIAPVGHSVQPMSGFGYVDSPESKRRMVSLLDVAGLSDVMDVCRAPMVSEEDLLRVHDRDYLLRFKAGSEAGGGDMGQLAAYGPGGYDIARVSAGLALAAVETVLLGHHATAYAMTRPCGHHATRNFGLGFCLFNNIAVAIEAMKARHGLGRVVVLDWDVHHGNGTQEIFYERDDVFTISLHQEHCFPPGYSGAEDRGAGKGLGFNMNIPLQPGGGLASYTYAFERMVVPAIDRFKPELIIVASGLDANALDPLSRMQLTPDAFRFLARQARQLAARHTGGKLVLVHEGGYSEACVPFCGLALLEELTGHKTHAVDPLSGFLSLMQPGRRFDELQRELIDEMAALHGL
ncbi:class II histone deacetylase [Burkholderia ambifaria]|uniref:class II histone deacetylase n=1 Tax=Burkholderia ambifaria TaxID=152480 RepID=UPI00158AE440|nr:class II histone deacetylase [Burkholderia ambifaria]